MAGLVLWLAGGTASGATSVWINTTSGGATWHSDANWNTVQPAPSDMAVITNGYKAIVTSDVTITNLQVRKGSALRLESGTLRITEANANAINIGNGNGYSTGIVEQVGGTLELTAAQAAYLGHDETATFYGRFSGGSLICTNTTGSAWLGIGRSDAKFDVEVSGSALWNVYQLRIGYTGPTTNGPLVFRQKDSSTVTGTTMVVGYTWGATYYMDGGINSFSNLSIEGKAASPAAMIVTGGVVRVTGGAGTQTYIGNASGSKGSLSVQEGNVTLVRPILGYGTGSSGAMAIDGGSVLFNGIGQEIVIGWNGSGTLDLSGGGLVVTNGDLTVGRGGSGIPGLWFLDDLRRNLYELRNPLRGKEHDIQHRSCAADRGNVGSARQPDNGQRTSSRVLPAGRDVHPEQQHDVCGLHGVREWFRNRVGDHCRRHAGLQRDDAGRTIWRRLSGHEQRRAAVAQRRDRTWRRELSRPRYDHFLGRRDHEHRNPAIRE
jgi:hypothetical protein